MGIEVIPVSRLQNEATDILARCCDSGHPVVIELPDHRLVAIQPLESNEEPESLVNELLEGDSAFRDLVRKSAESARRPFIPGE